MSKNKNLLEQIGLIYILYKFRWIIAIIVLVIIGSIMFYDVNKSLNDEAKKYGYNSFMEDIKYDELTGEIIPKSQIGIYNNDNKYITQGDKIVYINQIQEQLNKYKNIQGQYEFIKEEDKKEIDSICKKLFNEYLDIEYEIKPIENSNTLYLIHLKNVASYDYTVGAYSGVRDFVSERIKKIYDK